VHLGCPGGFFKPAAGFNLRLLPVLEQQTAPHVHQIVDFVPQQQQSFHPHSLQTHYGVLRATALNLWIIVSLSRGRDVTPVPWLAAMRQHQYSVGPCSELSS
jgi:predicted protein tyrosine phosphatase